MSGARAYLAEFLRQLAIAIPGGDPALRHKRQPDGVEGVCISLPGPVDVFLEDGDLGRPIHELVKEVCEIAARGRAEIERKRREFDERMGDAP